MKVFFKFSCFLFLVAAVFCIWRPPFLSAQTAGSGSIINLDVHNCNNNHICEPQFGENYLGCPMECSSPTSTPATSTPPAPSSGIAPTTAIAGFGSPTNGIDPTSITIYFISDSSAIIEWRTYSDSLNLSSWGKTAEGEIGTISEINYGILHRIRLDNLDPDTRYYFNIESRSRDGTITHLNSLSFITPSSAAWSSESILPGGTISPTSTEQNVETNYPLVRVWLEGASKYAWLWLLIVIISLIFWIFWRWKKLR